LTSRIANMMFCQNLTLCLIPKAPETGTQRNWYEDAWFKAEIHTEKGARLFQGEGQDPTEAIKDLLECNAFNIEELCRKCDPTS